MAARENGPHELELELRRVRSKAEAARLDARAAEIEMLLRQATRRETDFHPAETFERLAVSNWQELLAAAALLDREDLPVSPPPPASPIRTSLPTTKTQRRRAGDSSRGSAAALPTAPPAALPATPLPSREPESEQRAAAAAEIKGPLETGPAGPEPTERAATARGPAAKTPAEKRPTVTAAKDRDLAKSQRASHGPAGKGPAGKGPAGKGPAGKGPAGKRPTEKRSAEKRPAEKRATEKRPAGQGSANVEVRNRFSAANVDVDQGTAAAEHRRKRRPAAWIVSCVLHAALLLLLAAMTISVADPDDQITLDAAPAQASEETIETVVFEQAEQPPESSPPIPVATLAEVSPLGTILASEIEIETPEIRAPSTATLKTLQQGLAAGSLSATSLSQESSSEFFGAKGGGNHFVYLVDNSGSMATIARNGFDVARRELLKSIDALQEEQRFYVMFFGEEVLRMRLADPAIPEPRSVYATEANKAALRRWAMGVTMQSGRWPEKALEFAFELRPDVIFLLTDGEMSQRAEPMIRQNNLVENLFEGPHPRSIIHTVGFYSRDGAEQMQTIARVNGGTYHFIPPPPK